MQDVTLSDNVAVGAGGAIELETTGTGSITNTTIADNSALNNAGANGGGIDAPDTFVGSLALQNDTINANFATTGGGIFWAGTGTTFSAQNTIIAGNEAPGGGPDANNTAGTFTDLGGNLIGNPTGSTGFTATTTRTSTATAPLDPLLGPLGNNGGQTIGAPGTTQVLLTEALLPGSPAIGKGVATGAPTTDERGFSPKSDVGAFQFQDDALHVTVTPMNQSITVGGTETFLITVTNGGTTLPPDNTTLTAVLSGGLAPAPGTTLTFTLTPLAPGQSASFTVTAIATAQGSGSLRATLTSVDANPNSVSTTGTVTVIHPTPVATDPPSPFAGLTAQQRFVQALYLDDLGRAGGVAELNGWVAVLNSAGQRAVVTDIEDSFEARDRVVQGWYQTFLGRAPRNGEENGFANLLATKTEEQVLSQILASNEFYARAQTLISSGTPDQRYVEAAVPKCCSTGRGVRRVWRRTPPPWRRWDGKRWPSAS